MPHSLDIHIQSDDIALEASDVNDWLQLDVRMPGQGAVQESACCDMSTPRHHSMDSYEQTSVLVP